MNKTIKSQVYRFIEQGALQGACRYFEYWFVYKNIKKNSKVLELGAGKSALAQLIKTKGCDVSITEFDDSCLEYQTEHGINSIKTNNSKLPFEDELFDVVVVASSIEHFDPANDADIPTIKEAHRVLKPNGLFIATIPINKTYIKSRNNPPEKVYDKKEFEKRFLNGFEVVKMEFYKGSKIYPTDYIPHSDWQGARSIQPVKGFVDGTGLTVVLRKT